jgi:hypothetical protein
MPRLSIPSDIAGAGLPAALKAGHDDPAAREFLALAAAGGSWAPGR